MKVVPTSTWIPWNPVEKKKVDPYTPSAIVNPALAYSIPWQSVNSTANTTVMIVPRIAPRRLPWIREWCAYVTVAPEDRSRIVFSRGSSKGLIVAIPAGGHWAPSSTAGESEEWKNAQNTEMKKNTSLTMNRATPIVIPLCTGKVWSPRNVPSVTTSLNHSVIQATVVINPRNTTIIPEPPSGLA